MSMIASVLWLDRRAVRALRITDPYALHRVVYSLYEDVRTDADKVGSRSSGILYADHGGDYRGRKVLMLADRPPQERVHGVHGKVQSKPVPDGFLSRHRYRFKVIVNPTRRDSASRQLVAVRGREAIGEWFVARGLSSWGFVVDPQRLQVDRVEVRAFQGKEGHRITIAQAQVQGVLDVSDTERFRQSFFQGIGRGRAFGCGLLQIVPVIDQRSL
jgi:CRISPR system Cascade subunit CasE